MHNVKVLYKRNGENVGTIAPIGAYKEGMVDLSEEGVFCLSWDNDMLVKAKLYEVRGVELPLWMDGDFFAKNYIDLKYTWGMGADGEWSEKVTKGLMRLEGIVRYVAIKLLKTKKFKSEFRKAMHDRLVDWLNDSKGYATPWTPVMFRNLCNGYVEREYKMLSSALYRSN